MENSFSSKISDLINSNRQNEYIYDIFLRGTVKYIESKIEETMISCYVNKSLKDEDEVLGNIHTYTRQWQNYLSLMYKLWRFRRKIVCNTGGRQAKFEIDRKWMPPSFEQYVATYVGTYIKNT